MTEPVQPEAPPLPRPRILRQNWLDLTFLHWAVEPATSRSASTRQALSPTRSTARATSAWSRSGWQRPAFRTDLPCAGSATSWRPTSGCTPWTRRAAAVSSSSASTPTAATWSLCPHNLRHPLPPDPDAVTRPRRHPHLHVTLRWPGTKASSRIRVQVGEQRTSTALDHFLTARWGLHARQRSAAPGTCPTSTPPGYYVRPSSPPSRIGGLLASVGLPDLSADPPDHVAFSHGVPAQFGLPSSHYP